MSRLWFAAITLFAMVVLSALLTQPLAQPAPRRCPGPGRMPRAAAEIRALRADAVAVRLMLGVGDAQPQAWDGKVTIDQGEIVALEGARFRAGDAVTGPDSWKARSAAAPKATAQAKAQAKAKVAGLSPAAKKAALAKTGRPATGGRGDGPDRPGEGPGDRDPDRQHRTRQGVDHAGRAGHRWGSAPPRRADRGAAGARACQRDRDPCPGRLPRSGLRRPGRGLGRLRRPRAAGPGGLAQPFRGTEELQELCPQRGRRPGEAGPL